MVSAGHKPKGPVLGAEEKDPFHASAPIPGVRTALASETSNSNDKQPIAYSGPSPALSCLRKIQQLQSS